MNELDLTLLNNLALITDSPLLYMSTFVLTVAEHCRMARDIVKRGKLGRREEGVVYVIVSYLKPYVHQLYHRAIKCDDNNYYAAFLCSGSDNYVALLDLFPLNVEYNKMKGRKYGIFISL